ncbi:COMM domain-containing protein 6 isoform X2 [Bos indicus]|uniref:COMM domain-containing protein 6 isoform X2 n=1 Tax=Bos indicus TaxID=9915 RepID=A0ABM4T8S2_BOSIN
MVRHLLTQCSWLLYNENQLYISLLLDFEFSHVICHSQWRRNNGIPVPSPGLNKLLLAVCTCIITWSRMSLGQPAGSRKRVIDIWNTAEALQLSPASIGQPTANPQDMLHKTDVLLRLRRIIQRCFYPPPTYPAWAGPRGAGRGSGSVCGFWERPPEWMVGALNRAMEESSEPQLDAKSKVTNQVSEWPSSPVPRPALLGKGWATEPGPSPAPGSCGMMPP